MCPVFAHNLNTREVEAERQKIRVILRHSIDYRKPFLKQVNKTPPLFINTAYFKGTNNFNKIFNTRIYFHFIEH